MPATSDATPATPDAAAEWLGVESGAQQPSLVQIATQLHAVIGSQVLVRRWLRRRNPALGDRPLNLLRTPDGQARLLRHLDQFAGR